MASVIASITRNRHDSIIRGVRIQRSAYDKETKRDHMAYLGTIAQGGVDIPDDIAQQLTAAERVSLRAQLLNAAATYWQQRAEQLTTQLDEVHQAQVRLAAQHGAVLTQAAQRPTDGAA